MTTTTTTPATRRQIDMSPDWGAILWTLMLCWRHGDEHISRAAMREMQALADQLQAGEPVEKPSPRRLLPLIRAEAKIRAATTR